MKIQKAILILAISMLFFFHNNVKAQEVSFSDVNSNHWAVDVILSAVTDGIVDGYPDGTFKPDNPVGQKEFTSMLIRAYHPTDFEKDNSIENNWSKPYMDYAFDYGWGSSIVVPFPTAGALSSDVNMTRGQAAKLITNASGRNYSQLNSIKYLLDSNTVQGKVNNTVEGYLSNDVLTRAEALKLISNIKSHLDILYACPEQETTYDSKTASSHPEENMILEIKKPSELLTDSFSYVELENPKSGYVKIDADSFNLLGSVVRPIGSELNIVIEKKGGNGFVKINTEKATFNNGLLNYSISLSKGEGEYRITVYSPIAYNGKITQREKKITFFYVDFSK
jgi:uncharacterized protein YdbL (DUF1318 family)